jgi:hypothetical protein
MDDWAKGAIGGAVIGIVGALGVVGAALATGYYGFASKDEELRVHLVELAIGILRADPKEGVAPARAWAIEVIEKNSGIPFDNDDRAALLSKPIVSKQIGTLQDWKNGDFKIIPYVVGDGKFDFKEFLRQMQEEKTDKAAPGK